MTDQSREAVDLTDYLSNRATTLPSVIEVEEAAAKISTLFQAFAGATFNLYFGNMMGKPYLAVSIYQDQEARHSKWWNGKKISLLKLSSCSELH